jgi:hypothetical protein
MNATYEIHIERLKAIDRASRAVNKAAEMCFNMFLDHASENIRLARIQELEDYEAHKRVEKES